MANKTRKYTVCYYFKEDGNRSKAVNAWVTQATTVQRAISKLVKDINEGKAQPSIPASLGEDEIRASDLLVVDVRTAEYDEAC